MATVQVNVTQEDIDHGKRGTCLGCPIASAISRVIGPGYMVQLSNDSAVLIEPFLLCGATQRRVLLTLPPECHRFACDFDDGKPVAPFRFTIDVDVCRLLATAS